MTAMLSWRKRKRMQRRTEYKRTDAAAAAMGHLYWVR